MSKLNYVLPDSTTITVEYKINSSGEPEISEKEIASIKEQLIEEIIESEEFQDNLTQYYEDENADQADRKYDLIIDDHKEAN